jgi:hypothetical protein
VYVYVCGCMYVYVYVCGCLFIYLFIHNMRHYMVLLHVLVCLYYMITCLLKYREVNRFYK